jgi:cation:H+ antiporter
VLLLDYIQLVAGLIYLLGGGDLLVRGSVALARRTRVPHVVVALSVVAFGTSVPELVVSVQASLAGYPGLILGNAVGSNTANVLLVVGVAAVLHPLRMRDKGLRRTSGAMIVVTLAFAGLCLAGGLSSFEGWLLLAGFGVALIVTARVGMAERAREATTPLEWALGLPSKLPWIVVFIGAGIVALPLGASLLIESAVEIASQLGVSNTVIGLSLVAVGTSLPEVATTILAIRHRRRGVVLGTVVGSNIFNLLAIMGIAAVITPVPVSRRFISFDLPVMVGASLVLVALAWIGRRVGRKLGVAFLALYLAYLAALFGFA